jgi:CheY-like chemotaxis protein
MDADFVTALKATRPQPDLLPQELDVKVSMQYEGQSETLVLKRRRTTFGRGEADIVLQDPTASRKHFQLEVVRGNVVLHDLASANGTIYRGRWITSVNLKDGDHFQVGNTRFRISIKTTNLTPARLLALIALDDEESAALSKILDSENFATRTIDAQAMLELCRYELPDLLVVEGGAQALPDIETLKRLPRLRHTRVVSLHGPENASPAKQFRAVGVEDVLDRPVPAEHLKTIAKELQENPHTRAVNYPVSMRPEGYGDIQGRLVSLNILGARITAAPRRRPPAGTSMYLKLLLPNEYGVVLARGTWTADTEDGCEIAFTAFEGNGHLAVRRLVRDAAGAEDAS